VDSKGGGCGGGQVQALADGISIWSATSAFVPHGFRSSFEITWDCSRNVLIASSLKCHSFLGHQGMPARALHDAYAYHIRGSTSLDQAVVLVSHVSPSRTSKPPYYARSLFENPSSPRTIWTRWLSDILTLAWPWRQLVFYHHT